MLVEAVQLEESSEVLKLSTPDTLRMAAWKGCALTLEVGKA